MVELKKLLLIRLQRFPTQEPPCFHLYFDHEALKGAVTLDMRGMKFLRNEANLSTLPDLGAHLYRLPQAHLVCQDPVQLVIVQRDHPLEALHLVFSQLAPNQHPGLLKDGLLHRVRQRVVVLVALQDRLQKLQRV